MESPAAGWEKTRPSEFQFHGWSHTLDEWYEALLQEIERQLDWSLQHLPCAEGARRERLVEVLRVARDVLLRRMRDDAQELAKDQGK